VVTYINSTSLKRVAFELCLELILLRRVHRQPFGSDHIKRSFHSFDPTTKACGYIYKFNLSEERSIRTTFGPDPSTEGTQAASWRRPY
jgi:hypothetical protein